MELGPQNHIRDGLLGPKSITVVYMDPLGKNENGDPNVVNHQPLRTVRCEAV